MQNSINFSLEISALCRVRVEFPSVKFQVCDTRSSINALPLTQGGGLADSLTHACGLSQHHGLFSHVKKHPLSNRTVSTTSKMHEMFYMLTTACLTR